MGLPCCVLADEADGCLAPAYPPLNGEPPIAAPLDSAMTTLPGRSGTVSACFVQLNT